MDSNEIKQETQKELPQASGPAEVDCAGAGPQGVRVLKQTSDQSHVGEVSTWEQPPPTSTKTNESDRSWFKPLADVLLNRNEGLESTVGDLQKRLEKKDLEIEHLRGKLFERERELGEMKTTLRMYDDCSEFDITSAMNAINTKIQSFACNTALRWLLGTSKAPEVAGNKYSPNETEMRICRRTFGHQLAKALGNPPPEQGESAGVLLPLAWQACIVTVVTKILSSFVAGLPTSEEGLTVDNALRAVSELVKKGEIQPAYGRWRFVTHMYMKQWLIRKESPLQSYVDEAIGNCYLAARLALKSSCPDHRTFLDTFETQITEIMDEAAKLRTNMQEKMLTANYEPYLPAPGAPFKAESMAVDKEDREFSRDTVVCTTRLGMVSSRKKERENSRVGREYSFKAQVFTDCNLREYLAGK